MMAIQVLGNPDIMGSLVISKAWRKRVEVARMVAHLASTGACLVAFATMSYAHGQSLGTKGVINAAIAAGVPVYNIDVKSNGKIQNTSAINDFPVIPEEY